MKNWPGQGFKSYAGLAEPANIKTVKQVNTSYESVITVKFWAEGLGLDTETVNLIFESSLVHDIGKIGIPDSILQKGGDLSEREWAVMKKHCVMGADMLLPARAKKAATKKKTPFHRELEGG